MAMPESMIQDWERLTKQNQQQAHTYIRLLLSQQGDAPRQHPVRKLGVLSSRFHGIAEDFNAPVEAFKEYLQ